MKLSRKFLGTTLDLGRFDFQSETLLNLLYGSAPRTRTGPSDLRRDQRHRWSSAFLWSASAVPPWPVARRHYLSRRAHYDLLSHRHLPGSQRRPVYLIRALL